MPFKAPEPKATDKSPVPAPNTTLPLACEAVGLKSSAPQTLFTPKNVVTKPLAPVIMFPSELTATLTSGNHPLPVTVVPAALLNTNSSVAALLAIIPSSTIEAPAIVKSTPSINNA